MDTKSIFCNWSGLPLSRLYVICMECRSMFTLIAKPKWKPRPRSKLINAVLKLEAKSLSYTRKVPKKDD